MFKRVAYNHRQDQTRAMQMLSMYAPVWGEKLDMAHISPLLQVFTHSRVMGKDGWSMIASIHTKADYRCVGYVLFDKELSPGELKKHFSANIRCMSVDHYADEDHHDSEIISQVMQAVILKERFCCVSKEQNPVQAKCWHAARHFAGIDARIYSPNTDRFVSQTSSSPSRVWHILFPDNALLAVSPTPG